MRLVIPHLHQTFLRRALSLSAMTLKKIGTHDGSFHADEALACFLLLQLPEYKDADIVRSRDESVLAKCDVLVDVGARYEPAEHRYDHHQREFAHTMRSLVNLPFDTKLSSAGLVYAHFGKRVLHEAAGLPLDSPNLDVIYERVYANFIEEMDGVDNGIESHDGKARYKVTTTLSARVGSLYPPWNSTENVDIDGQFHKAMHLAGTEFLDRVNYLVNSWLPARDIVKQAIEKRHQVSSSGKILCLENGGAPWKEHLFNLEEELSKDMLEEQIYFLYVLYTDQKGLWRVQAVPKNRTESFSNRLPLPAAWRGLRDEELVQASGVPGATFVHSGGFIGGNATRDGAVQMAERAINLENKR